MQPEQAGKPPRPTSFWLIIGLAVGGAALWYWQRKKATTPALMFAHGPTGMPVPGSLPAPAPKRAALPAVKGARVLVIGDSLAVGMGPILEKALAARGSASYQNIARVGSNIHQWADVASPDGAKLEAALSKKPTLVIISLGTNDEAARKPSNKPPFGPTFDVAKQRAPAIKQLLARLAGINVVWLGPPTFDPKLWPMQRSFRDLLATSLGPNYFNSESLSIPRGGDNLHPTTAGHKLWVQAIMDWWKTGTAAV